jgi:hypothetical protein
MPYRNNPDGIALGFIKKPEWRYDYFSVGEFRELWYNSSGFWKSLKPSQDFFSLIAKVNCRRRLILSYVC